MALLTCLETQYQYPGRRDDLGISPLAPFQEFVQTFFGLTSFVCIADDLITNFHLGCQCSLMIEEAEIPKSPCIISILLINSLFVLRLPMCEICTLSHLIWNIHLWDFKTIEEKRGYSRDSQHILCKWICLKCARVDAHVQRM